MNPVAVIELKDHLRQKIHDLDGAQQSSNPIVSHLRLILTQVTEHESAGKANAAALSALTARDLGFLIDSVELTSDAELGKYLARKAVGFTDSRGQVRVMSRNRCVFYCPAVPTKRWRFLCYAQIPQIWRVY